MGGILTERSISSHQIGMGSLEDSNATERLTTGNTISEVDSHRFGTAKPQLAPNFVVLIE